MGIELVLATFKDESDTADDSAVVRCLANTMRATLSKSGRTETDVRASDDAVLVDLPGGTAEIHSDHAFFPIQDLDPLTLRVIFDVAKTGDMVVITEGGDYSTVVMDPSQRARLPEVEWQSEDASPVCHSPAELERLLGSWYRDHSEYVEKAVADWTAKNNTNPQAETPPASGGKQYRWDPWRNDFVENAPEPIHLSLYRFDPAGNEIPRHPDVLRDLMDVCQRHLQIENEPASRLIDDEGWPPISVRFRFYDIDIWPARAEVSFYELTPSVARLLFEIARAGDMSAIVLRTVILTAPGQATKLPLSWKETKQIDSCGSADELRTLLMSILQPDRSQKNRVCESDDLLKPVPGTYVSLRRIVYIQAKPKETAGKQQKKIYKHKSPIPDGPRPPEKGMLMSEFWRLETPAGQRFFAYGFGAEGAGWMAYLRDFAGSEGRAMGEIVNFETFVQDDGQRFPVSECKTRKVTPEEL